MDISTITDHISSSKKYKGLDADVIERVATTELDRVGEKQVESSTRERLHQIWGAYWHGRPDFSKLQTKLATDLTIDTAKTLVGPLLSTHTSTKERVLFLSDFYQQIFSITGVPSSVADYACGLNPLTYLWMNLPASSLYWCSDIDFEEIQFLQWFFKTIGLEDRVKCDIFDLLGSKQYPPSDISFLFKTLQVLEHQQKGSAAHILATIPSCHIVVSFPLQSIGQKQKGMDTYYRQWFEELCEKVGVQIKAQLLFSTELVFIVEK
jgi:hypothetical protein